MGKLENEMFLVRVNEMKSENLANNIWENILEYP